MKLSKTQTSKLIPSGGFLGRRFGSLVKHGLSLMKTVLTPLPKSVLIPLGSTAAVSTTSAGIYRNILGSRASETAILIISNKEIRQTMEIGKSLEVSRVLIKCIAQTIEHKMKNKKADSLLCDQVP